MWGGTDFHATTGPTKVSQNLGSSFRAAGVVPCMDAMYIYICKYESEDYLETPM